MMEEFKDNLINSILNMFSSGKSNLRCFLKLFFIGIIWFFFTYLIKNSVESFYGISPYWNEEIFSIISRINLVLFCANLIYWVIAIVIFSLYYFSEEKFIN